MRKTEDRLFGGIMGIFALLPVLLLAFLVFFIVRESLPAIREAFIPGTAVLVKASHAMHFTDIVEDLEASTK